MSDTRRYPSVPPLTLATDLTETGTTIKTSTAVTWNSVALASSMFNTDYIPATLMNDARTKIEFVLLDASTLGNIATTGITIYKRGLPTFATGNLTADQTEDSTRKLFWTQGESYLMIGTNPPWMYGQFPSRNNDEEIYMAWTFAVANIPRLAAAGTWGAGTEEYFITKRYGDALSFAGAPDGSTTQKGIFEIPSESEAKNFAAAGSGTTTADFALTPTLLKTFWDMMVTTDYTYGDTIAAGDVLYLDTATAKWGLADGSALATCDGKLGIALDAGVDTDTGKRVQTAGVVTGLSGLTAGWVYVSDTAGDLSASAGTVKRMVGYAANATTMILVDAFAIEQLTGGSATLTTTILAEMATFFASTDITPVEAERLTGGPTSNADQDHAHAFDELFAKANAGTTLIHNLRFGITAADGFAAVDTGTSDYSEYAGELRFTCGPSGVSDTSGIYSTSRSNSSGSVAKDAIIGGLTLNEEFSVEFQAKIPSASSCNVYLGFDAQTANTIPTTGLHFALYKEGATVYAECADGSTRNRDDITAEITLGQWNDIKIVRGASNIKFYVNNTEVSSLSANLPASGDAALHFLNRNTDGNTDTMNLGRALLLKTTRTF